MKPKPILLFSLLFVFTSFTWVLVSNRAPKVTCQSSKCTEKEPQKPSPTEAEQLLYGGFDHLIVSTSH